MLKKNQTIHPPIEKIAFALSHDFCDNGNTLAVRALGKFDKKEYLFVYKKHNGQFELADTFSPDWWHSNWQCSIRGINNSIYFVAVDTDNRTGYVMCYCNGEFRTVLTVDDCEKTLGMNDKGIAVNHNETVIAVSHITVTQNASDTTLRYDSKIILYHVAHDRTSYVTTEHSIGNNRLWSFRSLAFANNQLIAGSPDLTFTKNTSDTMTREYVGDQARVDVFDTDGNLLQHLTAKDATCGNFFGTEIETSVDGNTLIVMAPAQDNKKGCAYKFENLDNHWLQTGKYSPRDIAVHTDIKYSLYGCCVNSNGDKFVLADGLYGAIYVFENDQIIHTHKEINNYSWFGFDIKTDEQFSQIAVVEKDVEDIQESRGVLHLFLLGDK